MTDIPTQEKRELVRGIYQGVGGWWVRDGSGGPDQGPYITEVYATTAYAKTKSKKPKITIAAGEETVRSLCVALGVPVPDMDQLEGFQIKVKAGEPVRIIQTFVAVDPEA